MASIAGTGRWSRLGARSRSWRRWQGVSALLALLVHEGGDAHADRGAARREQVGGTIRMADTRDVREAFEAFFRAHEHAVFGYLRRVTGDEHAAYDLSQETFLRAWRHFARIADYDRPDAWLLRVATNLAFDHRRRRATRGTVALGDDERFARSDPELGRVGEADAVAATLLALPERQRAALVLREVHGLSGDEIAAVLHVSSGAAKMLLARAREGFRAQYPRDDAERGIR